MLLTAYTLNMIVHSIMYSYYFASLFIKDFDKIISIKKSITIMQMVSELNKLIFAVTFARCTRKRAVCMKLKFSCVFVVYF